MGLVGQLLQGLEAISLVSTLVVDDVAGQDPPVSANLPERQDAAVDQADEEGPGFAGGIRRVTSAR